MLRNVDRHVVIRWKKNVLKSLSGKSVEEIVEEVNKSGGDNRGQGSDAGRR